MRWLCTFKWPVAFYYYYSKMTNLKKSSCSPRKLTSKLKHQMRIWISEEVPDVQWLYIRHCLIPWIPPEGRKLLTGKKLHQFLIQQRLKHFINDAMHTNKTVIQHFAANTRQIMIWLSKLCRCMIWQKYHVSLSLSSIFGYTNYHVSLILNSKFGNVPSLHVSLSN